MLERPTTRRERNNDYSAVGTAGRRTGVTLPQGKLDENGLEEITALFSSPTKPSPLKQNSGADGDDAQNSSGLTPTQTLSARRSLGAPALPPPRSASPRKSGIGGSPRRSNGIDIRSPSKDVQPVDVEERENSPSPTPIRIKPRKFVPSPEKRILQEVLPNGKATGSHERHVAEKPSGPAVAIDSEAGQKDNKIQTDGVPDRRQLQPEPANQTSTDYTQDQEAGPNPMGDDEMEEFLDAIWNAIQDAPPVSEEAPPISRMANDKVAESIHPIETPTLHQKPPKLRNNARKRKSQELEEELVAGSSKKPCAAKVEVPKAMAQLKTAPTVNKGPSTKAAASQATQPPMSARLPGLTKDPNTHLSQRQQAELNQIIEKVKARPGKLKTLYVLKREKSKKSGADDVRSGRAVVKPLAYWSAEQCVYNNSNDGAAGLELGARIPLGSIKEIARDTTKKTRGAADGDSDAEPEDATSSLNGPYEDGHEEPWEREIGVFRGQANVWSQPHQTTLEDAVEETDLAYHPSSMLTREVKGSGFKYAKLISTPFFGSGIVDLPPGTSKLPKNSRTMHMCFFVFKGRVTVRIGEGIEEGDCERFSIGKGGVFQVPRGNKYSIENVLEKPARIFFSQASETVPGG